MDLAIPKLDGSLGATSLLKWSGIFSVAALSISPRLCSGKTHPDSLSETNDISVTLVEIPPQFDCTSIEDYRGEYNDLPEKVELPEL